MTGCCCDDDGVDDDDDRRPIVHIGFLVVMNIVVDECDDDGINDLKATVSDVVDIVVDGLFLLLLLVFKQ